MLKGIAGLSLFFISNVILAAEVTIPGYVLPSIHPSTETIEEKTSKVAITSIPPQTLIKLTPDQINQWQNFLNNLRSCTAGITNLKQINPALAQQYGNDVTMQVTGYDYKNLCNISMMYYAPNDPRLTGKASTTTQHPTGQDCQFTKGALQMYVTSQLDFLNKIINSTQEVKPAANPQLPSSFEKSVTDQCYPFVMINGEKNSVRPDTTTQIQNPTSNPANTLNQNLNQTITY